MKRTKILVTYGPAVASASKIKALVKAGVNAFRVNCSHGKTTDFLKAARLIRQNTREADFPIGLFFDISGPKLRLAHFKGDISISRGKTLTLTEKNTDLRKNFIAVNNPAILKSVKNGERLFIDDGTMKFKIVKKDNDKIVIKALNPGKILPGKGINLPDSNIAVPTISDKDREDIKTAVRVDADYIGLSFVRKGSDIEEARKIIERYGGRQKIIAKLERREAIENLEEIIGKADGVMVARGDLGVELPPEKVPVIQKEIINKATAMRKPVIIATQMLESMRFSPRATRAEINDVATAVFDFADAVMLSAETATGKYPIEAAETMRDVIVTTEAAAQPPEIIPQKKSRGLDITHAISRSVSFVNEDFVTDAIFAFTTSGFTAEVISNLFPPQPVIALTPDKKVMGLLSLFRSVYPVLVKQPKTFQDMLKTVSQVNRKYKLAKRDRHITITGGVPLGSQQPTNFMMLYKV